MPVGNNVAADIPTRLLERVRKDGNPVIESGRAWFVWSGRKPPTLVGDFNGWGYDNTTHLQPAGDSLWAASYEFLPDAYLEYAYLDGKKRLPDPFNPRRTPNGMGQMNQYFYMPAGRPTPLVLRRSAAYAGKISEHRLDLEWSLPGSPEEFALIPGSARAVILYQPPGATPCPLIVVFDGQDYHRRARLVAQVENLVAEGRMRPVALAMVPPYQPARMVEYGCSELTLAFLMHKLLPLARQHLNLVDPAVKPGSWGVMGASMGGLMALFTALRMPEIFGHVLSQSGAFIPFHPHPLILDLVQHLPARQLKIWMDAGRYEFLLSANQAMAVLLQNKGYDVNYQEFSAGHNYPAWRNHLHLGLEYLFPAR